MAIYLIPLNTDERALHQHATHRIVLKYSDLTETATNTDQTFSVLTLPANSNIRLTAAKLVKAFSDASDSGFNSTTVKVGDGSDDDRLLPAIQVNENGTEIVNHYPGYPDAATYTAPDATPAAITGGDSPTEAEHNALRSTVDSIRTKLVALAADVASLRARQVAQVGYVHTSATAIVVTVTSMSGKALNDLDNGEIHLFFHISDVLAPV